MCVMGTAATIDELVAPYRTESASRRHREAAAEYIHTWADWTLFIDATNIPDAALQCALSCIANVCAGISWWDSLPTDAKRQYMNMVPLTVAKSYPQE
jgi:hypothetical protein